jgi:hypothetical protein
MAAKGTIFQGLLEKVVLKAISRLTFATTGELRVQNNPTGTTQPVSGTVTATVANATISSNTIGAMTASGASQSTTQSNMQMGFRRNLTVS